MIRRIMVFAPRDYQNDTKSIKPHELARSPGCFGLVASAFLPGGSGLSEVGKGAKDGQDYPTESSGNPGEAIQAL